MLESKLLVVALAGTSLIGLMLSVVLALRLRFLERRLQTISTAQVGDLELDAPSSPNQSDARECLPERLKSGLSAHLDRGWKLRQTPEKYRYISLLAEHGMTPGQISSVLNLPVQEISQVLALARLAGRSRTAPAAKPKIAKQSQSS